jgi:hypothetical protein
MKALLLGKDFLQPDTKEAATIATVMIGHITEAQVGTQCYMPAKQRPQQLHHYCARHARVDR